jgi:hypothetical protein
MIKLLIFTNFLAFSKYYKAFNFYYIIYFAVIPTLGLSTEEETETQIGWC